MTAVHPSLPKSWSSLSWPQLKSMWAVKMQYGSTPDIARAMALLVLMECKVCPQDTQTVSPHTGETVYLIREGKDKYWTTTARNLSYLAKQAIPWFDYPYGDPGEKEVQNEKGDIVRPGREPVYGYVGPMRDSLQLPETEIVVFHRHFALPQVACNNLTWQQYRSLQVISPQLFSEELSEDMIFSLQSQFLANCLVPRSLAVLDTAGGSIRLRPHFEYRYNAEQTDKLSAWWLRHTSMQTSVLFHICFQCYQTALAYYSAAYPLLFGGGDKSDTMRDALQGEVSTINTVMKYAGYAEQQQVYDSNLPFVLDILNTIAKEAKEIEKMNAKIKKK